MKTINFLKNLGVSKILLDRSRIFRIYMKITWRSEVFFFASNNCFNIGLSQITSHPSVWLLTVIDTNHQWENSSTLFRRDELLCLWVLALLFYIFYVFLYCNLCIENKRHNFLFIEKPKNPINGKKKSI
jgi:hypothetical protein